MSSRPRPNRSEVRQALSTRAPRPALTGSRRLSLVVPAYREAEMIGTTVSRIRDELGTQLAPGDLEVVVVDDGSDDGTAQTATDAGADEVVVLPVNRGKGAAIRAGVEASTGRVVAFTDADLAYAPIQALRILQAVEDGWDVAIGSRRHREAETVVAPSALRGVGSRVINLATRLALEGGYADTQCGLKGFRGDVGRLVLGRCRIDRFAFDVELLAAVEANGLSVLEVPVSLESSDTSSVSVARDAVDLLADLVRIRRWSRKGVYDLSAEERRHFTAGADD